VIALQQLFAGDVGAQLDAAEEAEVGMLRGLVVHARDGLDLRMVRGHPGAHEAIGRREGVEEVHFEAGLQQLVGGVEARGARADDGGPQFRCLGHSPFQGS
jgi:hypothetical protein